VIIVCAFLTTNDEVPGSILGSTISAIELEPLHDAFSGPESRNGVHIWRVTKGDGNIRGLHFLLLGKGNEND
jgi:hypothetical protein